MRAQKPSLACRALIPRILASQCVPVALTCECHCLATPRARITAETVYELHVGVGLYPWQHTVVETVCEPHIVLVILGHLAPRLDIARHTVDPHLQASVLQLRADSKLAAHVVKRVVGKQELSFDRLAQVN